MKYDFTKKIKAIGVDGKQMKYDEPFHKTVANSLYQHITNLDLLEIIQKIWKGERVELRDSDIKEFKSILLRSGDRALLQPAARKALQEYFDEKELEAKEQAKKEKKKK